MSALIFLGSLLAFLGVALGAFGAHGLKSRVSPEMLAAWQTGVLYHLVHALGLILIGILGHLYPAEAFFKIAGWTILLGIVLFSGSLYGLVLTDVRAFGMVTPVGGVAFLAGWLVLALALWKAQGR